MSHAFVHLKLLLHSLPLLGGGLVRFFLSRHRIIQSRRLAQETQRVDGAIGETPTRVVVLQHTLLHHPQHAHVPSRVRSEILSVELQQPHEPAHVVLQVRRRPRLLAQHLQESREEQTWNLRGDHLDHVEGHALQHASNARRLVQMQRVDQRARPLLARQRVVHRVWRHVLVQVEWVERQRRVQREDHQALTGGRREQLARRRELHRVAVDFLPQRPLGAVALQRSRNEELRVLAIYHVRERKRLLVR